MIQFFKNKLKEKAVRYYDNEELRKELEMNTHIERNFFKLADKNMSLIAEQY